VRQQRSSSQLAALGLVAPSLLLITLMFVMPLLRLVQISFFKRVPGTLFRPGFTTMNYTELLGDRFYLGKIGFTLWLGLLVTAAVLVLGYPVAYFLARTRFRHKGLLIGILLAPLLTNIIVLVFAWLVLLSREGLVNKILVGLHLSSEPLKFLNDVKGVWLAFLYLALPYGILPLIGSIRLIDPSLEDAAVSLGATPWRAFWSVVVPLSVPGILAASIITFSVVLSSFQVAFFIGGGNVLTAPSLVYIAITQTNNWPLAAALSTVTFVVGMLLILLFGAALRRATHGFSV
jgi:putative spermidine/putrescine transport system permease protein